MKEFLATDYIIDEEIKSSLEFLLDYADEELKEIGGKVIEKGLLDIPKEAAREATRVKLKKIEAGERDLRF